MQVSIGLLWVEKNNQWTVDIEPEEDGLDHLLNEIAEYWENPELNLGEIEFPEDWYEPYFEELEFSDLIRDREGLAFHFQTFLSPTWKDFLSENQFHVHSAIWAPNNVEPQTWYSADIVEKLDLLEIGSVIYFDIYRHGFLHFDYVDGDADSILKQFEDEVMPSIRSFGEKGSAYGPINLFHSCSADCSARPCMQAIGMPASISILPSV